jgi:outer membrane protein assembly factor BamB
VFENKIVIPTGGTVTWLEDQGDSAKFFAGVGDGYSTLGLSLGEKGEVYRQWHRLDNGGTVQIYPLDRLSDGKAEKSGDVPGTQTGWNSIESLSFSSVSMRGDALYRCRPEDGFGLCRHLLGGEKAEPLGKPASISSPVLAGNTAIYGGLDGQLHFVPMSGDAANWSFRTVFGNAILAPVAVADGKVYFGCDDGHLYVLGADGNASLPADNRELWRPRGRLTSDKTDKKFNRFTSFADWNNSNANDQEAKPPFELKWIRRFKGTVKHFSTFGGGRMYTHTAEGQIFTVEQETGRLLWRRFFPGVHNSYTSPLYHDGQLFVPQAGFDECRLRCLDAETGDLRWEAPFTGSPSWNRQLPPVVSDNLVIYMFGTGKYGHRAPKDEPLPWLFEHQDNANFPKSHEPILTAFDRESGEEVWSRNFSSFGAGGDEAGVCLMDGVLYYSAFFGHSPRIRRGIPGPKGFTAAIDPATGNFIWVTTRYWMNGGCTISGSEGRLYLGGYNPVAGTQDRYVWCLDAKDGSLIWRSESLKQAIQVVTVGPRFLFVHAQYQNSYLISKETGKILTIFPYSYKCTRFSLSDPYLAGSNMDVIDVTDINNAKLISTGPRIDPSDCVGAVFSNGRMFYSGHGGGLQTSQVYGNEADEFTAAWENQSVGFKTP